MLQLKQAVEQRPGYLDAWSRLGTVLKEQGDADGAIAALRKSVELGDDDAATFNNLGLLLKRKGDADGSKAAFARAVELRQAAEQAKEKSLNAGAAKVRN